MSEPNDWDPSGGLDPLPLARLMRQNEAGPTAEICIVIRTPLVGASVLDRRDRIIDALKDAGLCTALIVNGLHIMMIDEKPNDR